MTRDDLLRSRGGPARISVQGESLLVRQGAQELQVAWGEVDEILAAKFDAWFMDTVCIELVTRRGVLRLTEDDPGFSDLIHELSRRYRLSDELLADVASGRIEGGSRRLWP